MYAVSATEVDGSSDETIQWKFLTTIPIHSSEDAKRIIAYYKSRWGIEVYFKILKSGCAIESTQFKFGDRFKACIAIVAWRIMMLTFLGRSIPGLKASVLFEPFEWKGIYCRVYETPKPPKQEPELGTVLEWGRNFRRSSPPAFLTPSNQEYHTRNCLMFKNHTNLRVARATKASRFYPAPVFSYGKNWGWIDSYIILRMIFKRALK